MVNASLLVCLRPVLTNIIRQEVCRKALGAVALGRVVVSITTEDQHRAAQQRRRVEVPGGATLCQYPPARERGGVKKKKRVTQSCEMQTVFSDHPAVVVGETDSSCQRA